MSEDNTTTEQTPATTGEKWGDPIDETRKLELWARLRAWWDEADHGGRKGPFARERLTGAEVFWLAVIALARDESFTLDQAAKTLRRAHDQLELDLSSLHLERADLAEVHLERAYLRRARLEEAALSGANLENSNLTEAHLERADLAAANLAGANLAGADLTQAHLEQAYLRFTQLQGANLREARLQGANLQGAHLEQADLREAQIKEAELSFAHLEGADLRGASFDANTRLYLTSLNLALVENVQWNGVNLTVVDWRNVNLGDEIEASKPRDLEGRRKPRNTRVEEFDRASRANIQLAAVLRSQGLDSPANGFTYRSLVMQRRALRMRLPSGGLRVLGRFLTSLLQDMIWGYGYKPSRSVVAYILTVSAYAAAFWWVGASEQVDLGWKGALVLSLTSFHGRGFFPGITGLHSVGLGDPLTILAASEAVIGIIIEAFFIASLTRRGG